MHRMQQRGALECKGCSYHDDLGTLPVLPITITGHVFPND